METLKKKAASRKNSLKLMYDILSGKEKENEKLRLMVEESKHILIAFCEEASRLYSEKSEEIAFKVQDSLEKLESLHRKVKRAPSQERPVQRSQPKSKSSSRLPERREGFAQVEPLLEENQNLQVRLLETELSGLKQSRQEDPHRPKQKAAQKNPYVDQPVPQKPKEDQAAQLAELREQLAALGRLRDALLLERDARLQELDSLHKEREALRDAAAGANDTVQSLQAALKAADQALSAQSAEAQRAGLDAKSLASQARAAGKAQEGLRRERDEALEAARALSAELGSLTEENSRLVAANEKLASDARVLGTQVAQSEATLKELKEKLRAAAEIAPRLAELEAALAASSQDLEAEREAGAAAARQTAQLRGALQDREAETHELRRAAQRATKEREAARESLEAAHRSLETRAGALQQRLEECLAQAEEKEAQVRTLESGCAELQREKGALELALKACAGEKERETRRTAAEAQKAHDGFALKLEALGRQVLALTEELEAKNTELLLEQDRRRQAVAEEKERAHLDLLETKRQAQKKLEETIRQASAAKTEELARVQAGFGSLLEEKEAEAAALRTQLDQLASQASEAANTEPQISFAKHRELLGQAEARLKEAQAALARAQAQLKTDAQTSQETVSELRGQLLALAQAVGVHAAEGEKGQDLLDRAAGHLESLRGELERTRTDHRRLKEAAATQGPRLAQLEQENRSLKEEVQRFNEQVVHEKAEVQSLSDKIVKAHEESKKAHEAQVKALSKQLEDLRDLNKKMQLQVDDAEKKLEEAHKLQYKVQIEKKKVEEIDEINKSEFERLSTSLIQAKEDIEVLKSRNDRLKARNEALDKSLKASEEEARQLREKSARLAADIQKDQETFSANLGAKLEEVNRLNSENELLKAKLDKLKESVARLEEKAAAASSNHSPAQTTEQARGMAEIREADEHEEVDEKHQIKQLSGRVETQQLTIRELRGKIQSLEAMLHGGKQPKEEGRAALEELGLEQLRKACQELQTKNAELAASLKVSIDELDKARADCKRQIELERRDKENQIHILDQNLEAVEANYLRELNEKTRFVAKLQEELEESVKNKDREIFYLKRGQESVNVAKSEEIEHLRRIVTENSNNPNDSGLLGDGRSAAGAETYRKQISHLESVIREFEKKDDDYAKLKAKYNKLVADLEEQTKKSRRSISNLDNLAQKVNETLQHSSRHNTQNNTEKDEPADAHLVDELKQRVEMLEEANRKVKLELEKELEIRKQFLNEYDYIRTESDYRITNEDIETMRSEKIKLSQEDRALFADLQAFLAEKFGLKKEVTRENAVKLLAKQLEKLAVSTKERERDDSAPKDLEGLQIENTQLKKQVTSLTTQYDHLKGVLVQKDRELRSGSSGGATLANQLADLINNLLASLDMKPLEALELARVKEAFAQISKARKRLLSEVRVKEEIIEDLKINSLKASSEREQQQNSGSVRGGDDFSRMKELLVKYHNVRKKLEAALSDSERLQQDKENLQFEIDDLKKSIEIEAKRREAVEIQLNILRQPNSADLSSDIKEHVRKLFGEFFKSLMESKDQTQANQILEVLTSIIGYSAEDKTRLFDSIKKSKLFDKILKKK